jgi:hypothetical protein
MTCSFLGHPVATHGLKVWGDSKLVSRIELLAVLLMTGANSLPELSQQRDLIPP